MHWNINIIGKSMYIARLCITLEQPQLSKHVLQKLHNGQFGSETIGGNVSLVINGCGHTHHARTHDCQNSALSAEIYTRSCRWDPKGRSSPLSSTIPQP